MHVYITLALSQRTARTGPACGTKLSLINEFATWFRSGRRHAAKWRTDLGVMELNACDASQRCPPGTKHATGDWVVPGVSGSAADVNAAFRLTAVQT